jgi:hypothetical protein
MSEDNSTKSTTPGKPAKPSPQFPLFRHATGRWAKKIRCKLHYFGPWSDPGGVLTKYLAEKDALHASRKPRSDPEALTVKELADDFLNFKRSMVDSGESKERSLEDYKAACDLIVKHFGKDRRVDDIGPDEFAALRRF